MRIPRISPLNSICLEIGIGGHNENQLFTHSTHIDLSVTSVTFHNSHSWYASVPRYLLQSHNIRQSVLRRVHGVFKSEFPRQHDLVFPLPVSSALVSSTKFHSCLHLLPFPPEPFYLFISKVLYKTLPTQDVTTPVRRPTFYSTKDVPYSLTICNTSIFTRSVQLISLSHSNLQTYYKLSSNYAFYVTKLIYIDNRTR